MRVLAFLSIVLGGLGPCAQGLSLRGTSDAALAPVAPLSEKDLAAVLFEVTPAVSLPMVAMNIRHRLPNTPIQMFYGVNNSVYVKNQPTLRKLREEGKLTLTPIPKPFFDHLDIFGYNILLESPEFWRATLDAKKLLTMQTDSWVCPHAASLLKDKFMQYDYVGAPWGENKKTLCPDLVGNGGTSFRDRAAMIHITEKNAGPVGPLPKKFEDWPHDRREDVWFCNHVPTSRKPTPKDAMRFAQEASFDGGDVAAFHNMWKYDPQWPSYKDAIEKVCPGVRLVEEAWNKIDNSSTFAASEEAVQKEAALFAQEEIRQPRASIS